MADKKNTQLEAEIVLKEVQDALKSQINLNEPEDFEDDYSTDTYVSDEDYDDILVTTTNLALIPESSWGSLRVSKKSFLTDFVWDFQDECSPLYKSHAKVIWDQDLDGSSRLTSLECQPLCKLVWACLYYCLPQNCILGNVRSYNSVLPIFRGFLMVAKFLHHRRLYVDRYGNGSYQDANLLTKNDIIICIEEQPLITNKLLIATTLKLWQDLSISGYLPMNYRLNIQAISNGIIGQLTKERNEQAGTFMPISLEALSIVVPYCINIIEKHAEEIIRDYESLHPIFVNNMYKEQVGFSWAKTIIYLRNHKSSLWNFEDFYLEEGSMNGKTKNILLSLICHHPEWSKYYRNKFNFINGKYIGKASNKQVIDAAREMGINLWDIEEGIIFTNLTKIRDTFFNIFGTFQFACLIIICLVTGMRISEITHLEANNAWPVPGSNDDYRLKFTVFKTDEASQGATVIIPIPEIAYKAYKALERITESARDFGKTNYLCVNIKSYFGEKTAYSNFNMNLSRFWLNLDLDENIHTHMFRKTLAMFAIYQDPRNINVVKHLFSHNSLAMTLAYIVKIPGMAEDIKMAIIENNMELLAEVLAAANNEKIGGKCGLRMKEQLKSSKLLARLNDDGRETLRQYVDSLLEQGLRILHRCPMNVICTNMHDSVIHISPELCDCEVTNCDFAVFTEASVPDLVEQIMFHEQWIKSPNVSEDQIRYSKRIINDCLDRLAEVQGKESAMAQFPVHYGLVA